MKWFLHLFDYILQSFTAFAFNLYPSNGEFLVVFFSGPGYQSVQNDDVIMFSSEWHNAISLLVQLVILQTRISIQFCTWFAFTL